MMYIEYLAHIYIIIIKKRRARDHPPEGGERLINNNSERPSIVFAGLNVKDPEDVGKYLYWLWHGEYPGEGFQHPADLEKNHNEDNYIQNSWKSIELTWGLQAPRQRMTRLLWQLLQSADERAFHRRFTSQLNYLVEDADKCAKILPPIQEHLIWVLDGLGVVDREAVMTGQANWGENWYMPREQARFVRDQLQKVHPDLLQKESDYQDAVRISLDHLVTEVYKLIEPPSKDPDRMYVGEIIKDAEQRINKFVWVEGINGRHPLPNAQAPFTYSPGNMAWGYVGHGSGSLALSILADAAGGNLELARQFRDAFLDEVVARFPFDKPMILSRREVLNWLDPHGISEEVIAKCQVQIARQGGNYEPVIRRWTSILGKKLYAQRFDLVPQDFESALYVDLLDMLQSGGRVIRCSRCQLPISYDGSPRSNRQRARWLKGQPVYHPWCFKQVTQERKRISWQRWAQDPAIKEKRRKQARERRKHS